MAKETDIFEFFEAEAEALQVVTVSRLPYSIRWSPATVYVVTAEDIQASGAKTLWDALRGVPGVDVMSTRTFYGEVSIRGLNKALNNRTMVLLDGR
ncbi:MAG: Plug domain-containing protein, partial [bacterium]|nr:Plug domain-containing protein [bacterium]